MGSPQSPEQRARSMSRTREAFALNRPLSQSIDKLHFDYDTGSDRGASEGGSFGQRRESFEHRDHSYSVSSTEMMHRNSTHSATSSVGSSSGFTRNVVENREKTEKEEQEDSKTARLKERQQQRAFIHSSSDSSWRTKGRSTTSSIPTRKVQSKPAEASTPDVIASRNKSGGWNSSSKPKSGPSTGISAGGKTPVKSIRKPAGGTTPQPGSTRKSSFHSSASSGGSISSGGSTSTTTATRTTPSVYARRPSKTATPAASPAPPVITSKTVRGGGTPVKTAASSSAPGGRTRGTPVASARKGSTSIQTPSSSGVVRTVTGKGGNSRSGSVVKKSDSSGVDTVKRSGSVGEETRPSQTVATEDEISPIRVASNPFGDLIKKTPPRDT